MPEHLFHRIAPHLLSLHRQTTLSWVTMLSQNTQASQARQTFYIMLDGLYYIGSFDHTLPCNARGTQTGILLIEAPDSNSCLSIITQARQVKRKEKRNQRVVEAIARKLKLMTQQLNQLASIPLFELTPIQGCFSKAGEQNYVLSSADLERALYPALHRLQTELAR